MKKLTALFIVLIFGGTLTLSCGDDETPAAKIPGIDTLTSEEKSAERALFPTENQIAESHEFIEKEYLGVPALEYVYTADYNIDGDIFKLFMTRDITGGKYINFRVFAEAGYEILSLPESVKFDEDYGFAFDHPEFGRIITGLRNNRLVGILGFDNDMPVSFFVEWTASLPKPEAPKLELLPGQ